MKTEFNLLQEVFRHALAKRLREVVKTESGEILENCRARLLNSQNLPEIPRVAQRAKLTVAQRRGRPPTSLQATFWTQVFWLARYQEATTLSNANFIRTFPHLRHSTSWIKMKRGNFGKQYPLLLERWTIVLRAVHELLDAENPNWKKIPLEFPATENLKRSEMRSLAWRLRHYQEIQKIPMRRFCSGKLGSPKTFLDRLLPGEVPTDGLDKWLQNLRELAAKI